MFITFEGLDYSGKSTQVTLLSDRLSRNDFKVIVLREPGGTEIGEKIRKILLDKTNTAMNEASELLLFSASRSQLVHEVIQPALDAGMVVICDRYYDSTTAYQGNGRGISLDVINTLNKFATGGLTPKLTFFLDIPIKEIEKRILTAKKNRDRMESNNIEFYEKVRNGYLQIAEKEQRYCIINGMQAIDDIHELIWQKTTDIISAKK